MIPIQTPLSSVLSCKFIAIDMFLKTFLKFVREVCEVADECQL
jgi:hypothetical protein